MVTKVHMLVRELGRTPRQLHEKKKRSRQFTSATVIVEGMRLCGEPDPQLIDVLA